MPLFRVLKDKFLVFTTAILLRRSKFETSLTVPLSGQPIRSAAKPKTRGEILEQFGSARGPDHTRGHVFEGNVDTEHPAIERVGEMRQLQTCCSCGIQSSPDVVHTPSSEDTVRMANGGPIVTITASSGSISPIFTSSFTTPTKAKKTTKAKKKPSKKKKPTKKTKNKKNR